MKRREFLQTAIVATAAATLPLTFTATVSSEDHDAVFFENLRRKLQDALEAGFDVQDFSVRAPEEIDGCLWRFVQFHVKDQPDLAFHYPYGDTGEARPDDWLSSRLCRTCGAATDVHLINCTLPLGSEERARTVCFTCTPAARVIEKYWTGFPSVMHARTHGTKCSECNEGLGYIHVTGREFNYRLCHDCAPDAKDCRRWVRDLL